MSTKILMTIVATMMLLLASTDTFAQTCTITPTPAFLQPNTEYFGNSSGTFKISVTGGCDPTPTINAPWITIYAQGATYVRLLVADNTGTVARQTTVTVAGNTFNVYQEASSEVFVSAGQSIQAALNALPDGDQVVALEAGATYTENFSFPNRTGATVLKTHDFSKPDGTRVGPADESALAKIVCSDCFSGTIGFDDYSHDIRIDGVEVLGNPGQPDRPTVVVGLNIWTWLNSPSIAAQPIHITFSHVYIHAGENGGRQGIRMDARDVTVLDSYISNFWGVGYDTQALGIVQGAGPFLIQNNYLEASGENFMSGGSDPTISGLVPDGLTVRDNYFFKPLSWRTDHPGSVKNLFEIKNATNVLVEHNVFENVWVDAQPGAAILLTVRNQDGACSWCTIQHVTFRNNVVKNVENFAFNLLGLDDTNPSTAGIDWTLSNNLVIGTGNGLLVQSPLDGLAISHNTFTGITGKILAMGHVLPTSTVSAFVFQNNAAQSGDYGITGDGSTAIGVDSLNANTAPDRIFDHNLIEQPSSREITYPTGNYLRAFGTWSSAFTGYSVTDSTAVASDTGLVGVDVSLLPQF